MKNASNLPDHVHFGSDAMAEHAPDLIREFKRCCSTPDQEVLFCAGMIGNFFGGICGLIGVAAAREAFRLVTQVTPESNPTNPKP